MVDEQPTSAVEATYEALVKTLLREPDVAIGRSLHNETLTVRDHIFGFRRHDELIVKLPAARAQELRDGGLAREFRTGGRAMREWVMIAADDLASWPGYLAEALAYGRAAGT